MALFYFRAFSVQLYVTNTSITVQSASLLYISLYLEAALAKAKRYLCHITAIATHWYMKRLGLLSYIITTASKVIEEMATKRTVNKKARDIKRKINIMQKKCAELKDLGVSVAVVYSSQKTNRLHFFGDRRITKVVKTHKDNTLLSSNWFQDDPNEEGSEIICQCYDHYGFTTDEYVQAEPEENCKRSRSHSDEPQTNSRAAQMMPVTNQLQRSSEYTPLSPIPPTALRTQLAPRRNNPTHLSPRSS